MSDPAAGKQPKGAQEAEYSFWDYVLLTFFIPGMGQYMAGQTRKGMLILIPSGILFVDIMVHTFIIALRIFAPVMDGAPLQIDNEVYLNMRTLLVVICLALAIWAYAMWDIVHVARSLEKKGEDHPG